MKIIIAVPSKGRISEPAVNMLEQAGLGLKDKTNRKLFSSTYNENIDVMFARAADIPEFVSEGIVDLGITGLDKRALQSKSTKIFEYSHNGITIKIDEKANYISIDDIKKIIDELPLEKRNLINEIRVVDFANKTEFGYAMGEVYLDTPNTIILYNTYGDKYKYYNTLLHEFGHTIDFTSNNNGIMISNSFVWKNAIRRDGLYRKGSYYVTNYAKQWAEKYMSIGEDKMVMSEDFAESIRLYLNPKTRNKFIRDFPSRSEVLKKIFNG